MLSQESAQFRVETKERLSWKRALFREWPEGSSPVPKNDKISNAGLYCLIIIAISIVAYVNMNNALKDIDSKSERNVEHSAKANKAAVEKAAVGADVGPSH
jgi:hypothetical protein